jgi:hypothetical protein
MSRRAPNPRAIPKTMCIGCGLVSPTTHDWLVHVSGCDVPPVRPRICPGCLTETWRAETCRSCGSPLG